MDDTAAAYEGGEGEEGDGGYYNELGDWVVPEKVYLGVPPPEGHNVDEEGRLLLQAPPPPNPWEPEDFETFISSWKQPWMSSKVDGVTASAYVWPDVPHVVELVRFDLYEIDYPISHQGSTEREESRRIRNTPGWYPVRSLFFLDAPTPFTKMFDVESTGPPRRHKFRPKGKPNSRDLSTWIYRETVHAFIGSDRIPGTSDFNVDFQDGPDRYFIHTTPDPPLGMRRLYRFAAYPCTQYFILEKTVYHDALESEGGSGLTYIIEKGPYLFAKKGWKIIGSFFAFDLELTGSNFYTVYVRDDPFPRMHIAIGAIARAEEWTIKAQFYAFDIPLPGSCVYTVHHCVRSIYSAAANVSRHRLTTDDPRVPWEFRMNIYVFPAHLEDCQITDKPVIDGQLLKTTRI